VVRALEVWRPYLEGNLHTVDIFLDHHNLEFFMTARDLNRWQARWSLFLNRFVFRIHHCPGHLSTGPDELSRRADHEVSPSLCNNVEQQVLGVERLGCGVQLPPPGKIACCGVVVDLRCCGVSEVVARVGPVIQGDAQILQHIHQVSRSDPKLDVMWTLDSAPGLVRLRLKDFSVDDGLVRLWGLIYVPDDDDVKRLVLQLYHDAIPAGHPGISNTLELVSRNYYWPRMSEYVMQYVEGCETCQRTKPQWKQPHGKLQPLEVPLGPWQHVSTDYIGPLPVSNGFDAIQVVCDKSTERAHFLPARMTDKAPDMCDAFMTRVWPLHGTPKKLVSDMGPQFVAKFTARMWKHLGIKWALSTVHHLQTDVQTERVNQELEVYLHAYVDYYQDDWEACLPFAEFSYNNRHHSAIGMSPFFAEYGYNPSFSINPVNSQSVPAVDERLDCLWEVHEELVSLLMLAVEHMKKFHDASVDESLDYIPGDCVYLERAYLRSTRPSHKVDYRRYGLLEIDNSISQ